MTTPNNNNDDRRDALEDVYRIRGETRMFPEGTDAKDVTDAKAREVIEHVEAYRRATGITLAKIAGGIGYSSSALSQVMSMTYNGDWQQVVLDLDNWLERTIRRDRAPKPTQFVMTRVAKQIMLAAEAAYDMRGIGLVYGPDTSGIGKSLTLRAIAAEKAGSILVTVEKARASPLYLFEAIAEAIPVKSGYGTAALYTAIKKKLTGTDRLLMIDQIHNLCETPDDRAFFMLADLHDATGAPQLWCGTTDIHSYFNRRIKEGKGRETLAQIKRRVFPVENLTARTRKQPGGGDGEKLYTIDEVRKVFAKNKIRLAPDAMRYLLDVANTPDSGALGVCSKIVQMATLIADSLGKSVITEADLRAVAARSMHEDDVDYIESRPDSGDAVPVAVAAG